MTFDGRVDVLERYSLKAMTHQPTQLLSRVGLGPVGMCVIGLQPDFFLHSSLIPDCLVGSRPPYDSTVELGWVMCHGLKSVKVIYHTNLQNLNASTTKAIDKKTKRVYVCWGVDFGGG